MAEEESPVFTTSTGPVRVITAASLFDGHDAAINVIRRLIQSRGAEVIHLVMTSVHKRLLIVRFKRMHTLLHSLLTKEDTLNISLTSVNFWMKPDVNTSRFSVEEAERLLLLKSRNFTRKESPKSTLR